MTNSQVILPYPPPPIFSSFFRSYIRVSSVKRHEIDSTFLRPCLEAKACPPLEAARPSSTVSLLKQTMKVETSSPSFAMYTEILEHSTMGRQPIKDVLAEYVSFEISVLMKDLAFRDLIIKDKILGTGNAGRYLRIIWKR